MHLKRLLFTLMASMLAIGLPGALVAAQESSPVVIETPVETTTETPVETVTEIPVETSTSVATPSERDSARVAAAAEVGGFTGISIRQDSISYQSTFTVDFAFTVPAGAQPGDTLVFTNGSSNVSYLPTTVELLDENGNDIGTAVVTDNAVTVTLSSYVADHINVAGSGYFTAKFPDRNCTPDAVTETVVFVTASGSFSDTIVREPEDCGRGTGLWKSGQPVVINGVTVIQWQIDTGAGWTGSQTITDTPGPGWSLDCSSFPVGSNFSLDECSATSATFTVSDMTNGAYINFIGIRNDAGPLYTNCASRTLPVEETFCANVTIEDGGEGQGELLPTRVPPTEVVPTEVAPTEVPPTEVVPTEVAPTEVPPTEVPPTEVVPTEVPPTEVPPTEVPPTEVVPTEVPPTEVPPTEVVPTEVAPTEVVPTEVLPTATATSTTSVLPTATPDPGHPTQPAKPTTEAPVTSVAVNTLPTTGSGPDSSHGASFALIAGAILLGGISLLTMRIRRR